MFQQSELIVRQQLTAELGKMKRKKTSSLGAHYIRVYKVIYYRTYAIGKTRINYKTKTKTKTTALRKDKNTEFLFYHFIFITTVCSISKFLPVNVYRINLS